MAKRKGFILVELCVVLALLGIMAALAVPSFAGMKVAGADHTAESSLRMIQSSFLLAKSMAISTGEIPQDGDDLENYRVTVHKKYSETYEDYFNAKVDASLPEELRGHYDIEDTITNGSSSYIIRYDRDGQNYYLKDGLFYKEGTGPKDPIQQGIEDSEWVIKEMVDLINFTLPMTDQERRAFFQSNNLTNDTYRKYLYYNKLNGRWPEMSQEFKDYYGLKQDHLYIQPYTVDVKNPDEVILFSNGNSTTSGNWYTSLIYYEGQWYSGKAFSISMSKENVNEMMEINGFKPLQPVNKN